MNRSGNNGPGSISQRTLRGGEDDDRHSSFTVSRTPKNNKKYEASIPARGIKWPNLRAYLEIVFGQNFQLPVDQKPALNDDYIVNLPKKLSKAQQQDIDVLRKDQQDIDEFLRDLREEMSELQSVSEEGENEDEQPPQSPTAGNRLKYRGGGN